MLFDLPVVLIIVLFLALGIFSQWSANQIKWLSVVVMSVVGLLVGPILGLASPRHTLGSEIFSPIVSLTVTVILFEGGSSLDFRELKSISKAVIRIITIDTTIAWILGAITLHRILGFPISIAIVMGGLLLIIGSTTIQPLLKQAKVRNSIDTVLHWESIMLGPLGPILALAAFYVYQIVERGFGFQLLFILIFKMLIVVLIGFGASFFFNWLIQCDIIPQNLIPSIQLVFVLFVFSIYDQILDEFGLLAVTVFRLMMARYRRRDLIYRESDHFIKNMSSIPVSTVFILITSSLTPSVLMSVLSWKFVIFSLVIIMLVRPITVLLLTIGTEITRKGRALVAMMAPRGIIVLTIAQFFSGLSLNDDMKMASYITPVTFGLVLITAVMCSFSFTPISKMLGLASTGSPGIILVGENEFPYHLGKQLQSRGIPVMVLNLFSNVSDKAEELDFKIFKGNLLSSSDRMYTDLIRYNKCLLMIKSFIFNSLAFNELIPEFGLNNVNMMPVSFTGNQARNNLNESLRNHILLDERHSPRWFDNVITNQSIVEVPVSSYHDITDKDMIIYHINNGKEATFHRNTKSMDEYDNGTYGILRNIYK